MDKEKIASNPRSSSPHDPLRRIQDDSDTVDSRGLRHSSTSHTLPPLWKKPDVSEEKRDESNASAMTEVASATLLPGLSAWNNPRFQHSRTTRPRGTGTRVADPNDVSTPGNDDDSSEATRRFILQQRHLQEYQQRRFHSWVHSQTSTVDDNDVEAENFLDASSQATLSAQHLLTSATRNPTNPSAFPLSLTNEFGKAAKGTSPVRAGATPSNLFHSWASGESDGSSTVAPCKSQLFVHPFASGNNHSSRMSNDSETSWDAAAALARRATFSDFSSMRRRAGYKETERSAAGTAVESSAQQDLEGKRRETISHFPTSRLRASSGVISETSAPGSPVWSTLASERATSFADSRGKQTLEQPVPRSSKSKGMQRLWRAAMGPSARSSQTGTEVSPRAGRSARQSAVSSVTGLTISHPADDPALSVEGEGGSGRAHRISQKQISRRRRESLDVVVSRVLGQPTEHRERGEQLRAAQGSSLFGLNNSAHFSRGPPSQAASESPSYSNPTRGGGWGAAELEAAGWSRTETLGTSAILETQTLESAEILSRPRRERFYSNDAVPRVPSAQSLLLALGEPVPGASSLQMLRIQSSRHGKSSIVPNGSETNLPQVSRGKLNSFTSGSELDVTWGSDRTEARRFRMSSTSSLGRRPRLSSKRAAESLDTVVSRSLGMSADSQNSQGSLHEDIIEGSVGSIDDETDDEDSESEAPDPIFEMDFAEFHFQKVRYSAVFVNILILLTVSLPVGIIELAALFGSDDVLRRFGDFAKSETIWSDPGCRPSMRKNAYQAISINLFSLMLLVNMWMLLARPLRDVSRIFYFCGFCVLFYCTAAMVSWLYVNRSTVSILLLALMAFPSGFHLRTKHTIPAVVPPMLCLVIMTAAGRTSEDLCATATVIAVVVVAVAFLVIFETAIREMQLRRLYESVRVHKEQLNEQKDFLKHMLPPQALKIALAGTSTTQGNEFECGTIMMVDVNMEEAANLMAPSTLVEGLDRIFSLFDVLIESAPKTVYKVETVGSVYMVAAGVPFKHPDHAHLMLETALQFLDTTASLQWSETLRMKIRCGVHSGKLFAGVPGMVCPRYRYFGDTVNTAARLESKAPWGRVWVSEGAVNLLQEDKKVYQSRSMYDWDMIPLGNFWFKGKGNLPVWEVVLVLAPDRAKVVVGNVESEATQGADQAAQLARKRMSELLERPSLMLKDSDRGIFRTTSFSLANILAGWMKPKMLAATRWCRRPASETLPTSKSMCFAKKKGFKIEAVKEVDFEDPRLTLLLTFKNPRLEYHHDLAEQHVRKRVLVSTGLVGLAMVTWCVAALASAGCDTEQRTALLAHTIVAFILALMLSLPLIVQFHWTVRWWPCISLLLLLLFMAWQIALPCGGVPLESKPAQQGMAFVWVMLAHTAFGLPFRYCIVSTLVPTAYFVAHALPSMCQVDARVIWPECAYDDETEEEYWNISVVLVPVLIALHTFWTNEASNRRHFVKLLQGHYGRQKAVNVVKSLLPEHVFRMQRQVGDNGMLINHYIPMVNQLFSDIVGFTSQAAQMKPIAVFEMIATLFGVFDERTEKLGVLKIETIGDAYWACTGSVSGGECLPIHATSLALFAFQMQEEASKIFPLGPDKPSLKIRIGLHSGPVVGGITGTTMPRYHFFGPHVALTNQMESLGSAHYLHVTNSFATLLRRDPLCPLDFDVITRDVSLLAGQAMPQCEIIRWEQVNASIRSYGTKLRLGQEELRLLTPVATITRQRGMHIQVQLKATGEHVEASLDLQAAASEVPSRSVGSGASSWGFTSGSASLFSGILSRSGSFVAGSPRISVTQRSSTHRSSTRRSSTHRSSTHRSSARRSSSSPYEMVMNGLFRNGGRPSVESLSSYRMSRMSVATDRPFVTVDEMRAQDDLVSEVAVCAADLEAC